MWLHLIAAFCYAPCVFGSNILAVTTLGSPSHHIWNEALVLGLVERGHNITMLTHETPKVKIENYTAIILEGFYEAVSLDFEDFINLSAFSYVKLLWDYSDVVSTYDQQTEGFKTLMNYPQDYKFDVILWDVGCGHALYPIIERFGSPPVVGISPWGLQHFMADFFGNQIFFTPSSFDGSASPSMGLLGRLRNLAIINAVNWWKKLIFMPAEYHKARAVFGNCKALEDFERNMSLLLVNTDPIWEVPMPMTPNIIPVGGLHIKSPKKLPADLQKILDESDKGVVYFSLGTNLRSEKLTHKCLESLIRSFSKIPYTVLWKVATETLDIKLPPNVIIRKWLPQNDVLAHRNVILFFTHGGALSTQESLYHGVPMLIMPFFLDQHSIAIRCEERKLGRKISYHEVTEDLVYQEIMEVTSNPIYRSNMRLLSRMFKDQPQSPLERAIFWVEYTLKHGHLRQLDVAARDMYFIESIHLHIIVLAFFILYLCLYGVYKMILKFSSKDTPKKKKD